MVNPAQVSSTGVAPTLPGSVQPAPAAQPQAPISSEQQAATLRQNAAQEFSQLPKNPSQEQITQADKLISETQAQRDQQAQQMIEQHQAPKPPSVDSMSIVPQQAQSFLPLMMALSAISGARTSTPMIGAIQNMNAVMKAQITGNKEFAEHHEQQMWEQYNAAMTQHKEEMANLKPAIAALASGSPESLQEYRHALLKNGVPINVIEGIMNGDVTKNAFDHYAAAQKFADSATQAQESIIARKEAHEDAIKMRELVLTGQTAPSSGLAGAAMAGLPLGMGKNQVGRSVSSIKELHPELSEPEIALKMEMAKELNKERTQQLVMKGKVDSFERTALGNIEQIEKELDEQMKSRSVDIPAVNRLLIEWKKATGQAYSEGINLFGQESAAELAKLASSATAAGAGGTLTDREEWKAFFAPNGSYAQMKKSLDSARTAIKIRTTSADDAVNAVTGQLKDLWGTAGGGASKTAPPAAIEYLKSHPEAKDQFKAKYGYLP